MQRSTFTTTTIAGFLFFFLHQGVMAQDVQREIGIRANSFEDFSAIYKWQKAENKYGRLTAALLDLGLETGSNTDAFTAGISVTIGNENRRSLADRTDFLHGLQYVMQATYSDTPNQSAFVGVAGISYLIGLQYSASDRFNVGIEFLPSLLVSYIDNTSFDRWSIDANANFANATLSATYRFSSAGKESRK